MSRAKSSKGKPAKHARKRPPKEGELADETLDQVSGGGRRGDAISELSEMDMLQLQQASQAKSQAESMISNTMKASQDTQNTIAQNLKA
jgi:hypothetical protein